MDYTPKLSTAGVKGQVEAKVVEPVIEAPVVEKESKKKEKK